MVKLGKFFSWAQNQPGEAKKTNPLRGGGQHALSCQKKGKRKFTIKTNFPERVRKEKKSTKKKAKRVKTAGGGRGEKGSTYKCCYLGSKRREKSSNRTRGRTSGGRPNMGFN